MDKTLDLDELERVAKRATQARRYRVGPKVYARGHGVPLLTVNDLGPSLGQQDEDATYIATFDPPTILTLIAAARPAETRDWSEFEDEVMPPGCVNHDDRARVTNLDGDNLCQECADAWVRAEGQWQAGQSE